MRNKENMENKREKLYRAIEQHGLDHENVIEIDKELHKSINKIQRQRLAESLR